MQLLKINRTSGFNQKIISKTESSADKIELKV